MTADMSTDRWTDNGQSLWLPRSIAVADVVVGPERTPTEDEPSPRPPRERTPRPWDAWPANVRVAIAGTVAVLLACWTVSFDAIVVAAQAASMPLPIALLTPFIVDGEMAVGTLVLVSISRHVKRRTRVYLGVLILLSVAVSMAANMVGPYTRTHLLGPPWSYVAAGVPSLWIAFVVHQLVILWRHVRRPDRQGVVDTPDTPVLPDVQPEVSAVPAPEPQYGVRSADSCWWWDGVRWQPVLPAFGARSTDGQWWWDGGQWRPVHLPVIEPDDRPEPDVEPADTDPDRPVDDERPQRPPAPVPAAVAARRGQIVAFLREQADAGRDPADVGVSELSAATGIPRPTLYRLLPDILSTFRNQPAMSGQGVAA